MRRLLATYLLLFSSALTAQIEYRIGFLPGLNIKKELNTQWQLNFKLESRFEMSEGIFGESSKENFGYQLTDISGVLGKKVGVYSRVSGGYVGRFNTSEREILWIHRFLQQYFYVQSLGGFRLAHRLRTDQTFSNEEAPEYRLRYRLATDFALSGTQVDAGEVYFKIGNEYVGSFQGADNDLEIRLVPVLGYYVNDDNKIELGVDYRINSFLGATANHRFWMHVGYYLSL